MSPADASLPPELKHYYHDEGERRRLVGRLFQTSARHYDRIAMATSFGSNNWYRREALKRSNLGPGMQVLDVACGTGVIAGHAKDIVGDGGFTVGLDPSYEMLLEARHRLQCLVRGQAEQLPFRDAHLDLVSMGFALRHVSDLAVTFREYMRVLKPGGSILILEMTRPDGRLAAGLLKLYMRYLLPPMAAILCGTSSARELMNYNWDTIEHFVSPEAVMENLRKAGFEQVSRHVEIGIFSEYRAVRPHVPQRST